MAGRRARAVYDSARWGRVRRRVLRREPLCRPCKRRGLVTAATEVDHVRPIAQGGAFWDERNLQAICRDCHMAKTADEGKGATRRALDALTRLPARHADPSEKRGEA